MWPARGKPLSHIGTWDKNIFPFLKFGPNFRYVMSTLKIWRHVWSWCCLCSVRPKAVSSMRSPWSLCWRPRNTESSCRSFRWSMMSRETLMRPPLPSNTWGKSFTEPSLAGFQLSFGWVSPVTHVPTFSLTFRFFYKHIWRQWDEEDEDDDFDYFVRCVEPRLRLWVHCELVCYW